MKSKRKKSKGKSEEDQALVSFDLLLPFTFLLFP